MPSTKQVARNKCKSVQLELWDKGHFHMLRIIYHVYPNFSYILFPYHTCPKYDDPFYCLLMC